jgi:predicted dehydrogenase
MKKLKVGIIGCGSIAELRHAPEFAANPGCEIVAYFDPNHLRAQKLAALFGGRVMESYEEITRDPSIDAISDCSTNEMHHVITTDALLHGKHVLCEKPMAISLGGAQQMVEASRKTGKKLMIAHNQRLAEAHQVAHQLLHRGDLGRVLTFQTKFGHKGPEYWSENKSKGTWFFDRRRSVFGVAGDLGIHKLDLLRYLLDDEITDVSGFYGTLDKKLASGEPIPVNDNLVAVLKTARGALGTLAVSWTYYGPEDNSTTLYCEKGILQIYTDPVYQLRVSRLGGREALYKLGEMQTNDAQTSSGVIDAFVDCILKDTPPLISGEDGLKGLQIVLALLESAEKSQAIHLGRAAGG